MPAHQQQYLGRLAFNSAEEALRSSSADSLKQSGRSPLIAAAAAATKLLIVCVCVCVKDAIRSSVSEILGSAWHQVPSITFFLCAF